jgi:hypothetical protein
MGSERALILAVALAACAHPAPPARVSAAPAPRPAPSAVPSVWSYRVDAAAAPRLSVEVELARGGAADLVVGAPISALQVLRAGAWSPVAGESGGAHVPECVGTCRLRYLVDLRDADRGLDGALEVGESSRAWLAPGYAWLLRPSALGSARVEVRFAEAPVEKSSAAPGLAPISMLTGMPRDGGAFAFPALGFGEAGFTAFGHVRHRVFVAEGAEIDVAVLGDRPLALGDEGALRWASEAARAVTTVYGRFPVPHAAIFAVPVPEADEVLFGKTLALGGPSVVALVGEKMAPADVPYDWVLVHEMVHLGFPTLWREARWLGEGIATYYEPIARSRAGIRTPQKTWSGFARDMHRARARGPEKALERRGDIDSIYWGGALFCLMADVRIRERTGGARSLDTVLRGILAEGGDARSVWTLERVVAAGNRLTGTTVLRELVDTYAYGAGADVDPAAELAALGVRADGTLDDAAPRAALRRAITSAAH